MEQRTLFLEQILKKQHTGCLEIGIFPEQLPKPLYRRRVELLGILDVLCNSDIYHGFLLPISNRCIINLVYNILNHLLDQFFPNGHQLLGGIIFGSCGKASLKVIRMLLVIDKAYND